MRRNDSPGDGVSGIEITKGIARHGGHSEIYTRLISRQDSSAQDLQFNFLSADTQISHGARAFPLFVRERRDGERGSSHVAKRSPLTRWRRGVVPRFSSGPAEFLSGSSMPSNPLHTDKGIEKETRGGLVFQGHVGWLPRHRFSRRPSTAPGRIFNCTRFLFRGESIRSPPLSALQISS